MSARGLRVYVNRVAVHDRPNKEDKCQAQEELDESVNEDFGVEAVHSTEDDAAESWKEQADDLEAVWRGPVYLHGDFGGVLVCMGHLDYSFNLYRLTFLKT